MIKDYLESLTLFFQNTKLSFLSTDVSGMVMTIADIIQFQKLEPNGGRVRLQKIKKLTRRRFSSLNRWDGDA